MIQIKRYKKEDQEEIDAMLTEIANEFDKPISSGSKSNSLSLDKYWVAFYKGDIIGTIGAVNFENDFCILKSMFVKKEYRGKELGTAILLLNKLSNWCETNNIDRIYLGTMNQFKAAHKFYEKNGFKEINKDLLPSSFINNPIDDVFFLKTLF